VFEREQAGECSSGTLYALLCNGGTIEDGDILQMLPSRHFSPTGGFSSIWNAYRILWSINVEKAVITCIDDFLPSVLSNPLVKNQT
jgi:hypothetical protein